MTAQLLLPLVLLSVALALPHGVEGIQFAIDDVATRKPEAKRLKPAELIDVRFVKELEESGFVKVLYGEK
jgi:hypothetical protein